MIGMSPALLLRLIRVCLCIDSETWIIGFGRNVCMNWGFG